MMWRMDDWWHMSAGFGFHWIFFIGFWGLVLWAVIALVRQASGYSVPAKVNSSALKILQERYARGELTREQFEDMTEQLRRSGTTKRTA